MIDARMNEYEKRNGCRLLGRLGPGPGQDGFVQRTDRLTAVKFFDSVVRYNREKEVYQLLRTKSIHMIEGHNIPELIGWDDELLTIEMRIVERPFLLDFAGAKKPNEVPDFEQHTIDEHSI